LVIEVQSQVSSEAEGFYNVIVRIRTDFLEGKVGLDTLSEISMALTLSQAERLRECLALFFEERPIEFPVSFHFEGDNTRREIGAPNAYVHRREHGSQGMAVTLTVDRNQQQDERLKLELRALQENVGDWFADIVLSREQALLFAYMVYYSAKEAEDWPELSTK
jgi:hypothetical protein